MRWRLLALLAGAACAGGAHADTTYLAPDAFIQRSFRLQADPRLLWLDAPAQQTLEHIYGHRYALARVRYWAQGPRSAWILEDIGKEFPITAGFVVEDGRIVSADLLVYRETRGDEIRYPAFLKQFSGAVLKGDDLDRPIDAVSGATLSRDAMRRMARTALALDRLKP